VTAHRDALPQTRKPAIERSLPPAGFFAAAPRRRRRARALGDISALDRVVAITCKKGTRAVRPEGGPIRRSVPRQETLTPHALSRLSGFRCLALYPRTRCVVDDARARSAGVLAKRLHSFAATELSLRSRHLFPGRERGATSRGARRNDANAGCCDDPSNRFTSDVGAHAHHVRDWCSVGPLVLARGAAGQLCSTHRLLGRVAPRPYLDGGPGPRGRFLVDRAVGGDYDAAVASGRLDGDVPVEDIGQDTRGRALAGIAVAPAAWPDHDEALGA
jgi:hypothetical protein